MDLAWEMKNAIAIAGEYVLLTEKPGAMKYFTLITCLAFWFPVANTFSQEIETIELIETDASSFGEIDETIHFQDEITLHSFTEVPIFIITSSGTGDKAEGWFGVTSEYIYFKIKVEDDDHFNPMSDNNLWQGDAVQLGIDAHGDGTQGNDQNLSGAFGEDDVALTFGMGENGPQGWVQFLGKTSERFVMDKDDISISREGIVTSYSARISWELVSTQPALFPNIGIAVQVNDSDQGRKDQDRYSWGDGAGGRMKTGLFKRIRLEGFPDQMVGAVVQNNTIWGNERARYLLAYKSKKEIVLKANYGKASIEKSLEANDAIKRFYVLASPGSTTSNETSFLLSVRNTKRELLVEGEQAVILPEKVFQAFLQKTNLLIRESPHELFTRHLKSLKSITTVEWARSELVVESNKRHANETLDYIQNMLDGLNGPAGDWENYKAGKISMIISYVSARDRSQQFYILNLPKQWDPENTYPLFVELHGAGNQNPLSGPSTYLSGGGKLDLDGYESIRVFAARQGKGYHIQPFARGNTGYRDIGEVDVWEAFHDVHQMFKIDEDRRYLFGFSMGGGGTAHLGLHTPHIWAALAVYSGSYMGNPGTGLGRNVSTLPVWMWCGEADFLYPNMKRLETELRKYGPQPDTTWIPNLGHNYRADGQEQGVNWLQQHTRERPGKFSFVSDDNNYTGTWGIEMKRDLSVSGMPHFDCTIEANKVIINSEGTEEITIDFGSGGLQLEGNVTVIWNGDEMYRGTARPIRMNNQGISDYDPMKSNRWNTSLIQQILKQY